MSDMYKRIESLCKERGVNITQMCKDAGIPRGNLTELKMGRTIALSTKTLDKISAYFGVSMEHLLGKAERFPYVGNEELLSAETLASLAGEETKKPTDQKVDGLRGTGYYDLTPENQKVIDSLIETKLNSQSRE